MLTVVSPASRGFARLAAWRTLALAICVGGFVIPATRAVAQCGAINFEELEDVAASVEVSYQGTRFSRRNGTLLTYVLATNASADAIGAPLLLVIDSISAPGVTVQNADGTTPDGKPFFDLSGQIGEDCLLSPGETSVPKKIAFVNPARRPFSFQASCIAIVPIGVLSVTIESPENLSLTNTTDVDVVGSVGGGPVSVEVNGIPAIINGGTYEVLGVPLSEGTNTLSALALDGEGGVATANVQVVRDTTPPVVVISSPQDNVKVFSPEVRVRSIII